MHNFRYMIFDDIYKYSANFEYLHCRKLLADFDAIPK